MLIGKLSYVAFSLFLIAAFAGVVAVQDLGVDLLGRLEGLGAGLL